MELGEVDGRAHSGVTRRGRGSLMRLRSSEELRRHDGSAGVHRCLRGAIAATGSPREEILRCSQAAEKVSLYALESRPTFFNGVMGWASGRLGTDWQTKKNFFYYFKNLIIIGFKELYV